MAHWINTIAQPHMGCKTLRLKRPTSKSRVIDLRWIHAPTVHGKEDYTTRVKYTQQVKSIQRIALVSHRKRSIPAGGIY